VRTLLEDFNIIIDRIETATFEECDTTEEDASAQEDEESLHDFSEASD